MGTNLTVGASGRKSFPPSRTPRKMRAASAVRVLGVCGLLSAALSAAAGFLELPLLLGVAGATMIVGNLYAIVGGRRDRRDAR